MAKVRRRGKRHIQGLIERYFDLDRLNYSARSIPAKNKTKLFGVLGALLFYLLGFVIGLVSMQNEWISAQGFGKLVWVLMVPASVVGFTVWIIIANRKEFEIREDIRLFIKEVESEKGLLCCFEPIISELDPNHVVTKKMIKLSKCGAIKEMYPDEYAEAVYHMKKLLDNSGSKSLSHGAIEEICQNIEQRKL